MNHYQWSIGILLAHKYNLATMYSPGYLASKDLKLEFTDKENTMLAISSLIIVFSIGEIILAVASAKSCSGLGHEPSQENNEPQVSVSFCASFVLSSLPCMLY